MVVCSFSLICLTGELSQQGSKHKEEVAVLQKSISALDREKDVLQDEVDEKTEKLVVLQEELYKKVAIANKQLLLNVLIISELKRIRFGNVRVPNSFIKVG